MATETSETQAQADWRRMHAFGWPSGSVRAVLAVMVFATVWGLLVLRPTQEVPGYLRDLLFIIMGHYFATRRRAEQVGGEPGPPPLYLPSGTIRLVLIGGSAAVAVVLYRRGQLTTIDRHPGVVTLLLVGGFMVGVLFSAVVAWWRGRVQKTHRVFEDVKAFVSVAAGVVLVALVWNRLFPVFPPEQADTWFARWVNVGRFGPENVLAAVVGFYFGSRS